MQQKIEFIDRPLYPNEGSHYRCTLCGLYLHSDLWQTHRCSPGPFEKLSYIGSNFVEEKTMKKETSEETVYSWKFPDYGLFEACVVDGKITDVRLCQRGSTTEEGLFCSSETEPFLVAIYTALGELLRDRGLI